LLTNILGPNTEEVRGEWGKLRNETLHELCLSPVDQVNKNAVGRTHGTYVRRRSEIHTRGMTNKT